MITAAAVHETLGKYILVDGFSHVADLGRSEGSWFVDARDQRRYLDCYSMHAASPLGWNHPKMMDRLYRLYDVVAYNPSNSDCYTVQYAEFVEAFASLTPNFKHYYFVAGGTLGVENALKAAFDYKAQKLNLPKDKEDSLDVIHFFGAFHGRSGYTLSLTNGGSDAKTRFYPKMRHWVSDCRVLPPATNRQNNIEEEERVALSHVERIAESGNTAAILLEPIQGEGGDNHFRPTFFQGLRQIADKHDIMLIFDEVQTGVGLTGKMWCHEHFGVVPDLMCYGKKTQVCGFCSTDRIDSVPNNVFTVSGRINSTWGGNLVDMVRATIYFEIIKEDNLVQNAAEVGAYFLQRLQEIEAPNARGQGLMIAFDCVKRDEVYQKLSEKILCLKSGMGSIRFRPHLDFTKEHADYAVQAVKEALAS